MKPIKVKIILLLLTGILLNSCIVKSLFPFYTKKTIYFEDAFLGTWKDSENKDNRWIIASAQDFFAIQRERDSMPPSKDELDFYNKYKNGYYALYEEPNADRSSLFIVMPFKIKNQLFLDFVPYIIDLNANSLVEHHLIPTHSLAKFDILNNNSINIKWLSSNKIKQLIKNNKIKISHEKIGPEEKYLLTASSVELQKFIAKYMVSEELNKWKTDVKFSLTKELSKEETLNLVRQVINNEIKLSGF